MCELDLETRRKDARDRRSKSIRQSGARKFPQRRRFLRDVEDISDVRTYTRARARAQTHITRA